MRKGFVDKALWMFAATLFFAAGATHGETSWAVLIVSVGVLVVLIVLDFVAPTVRMYRAAQRGLRDEAAAPVGMTRQMQGFVVAGPDAAVCEAKTLANTSMGMGSVQCVRYAGHTGEHRAGFGVSPVVWHD